MWNTGWQRCGGRRDGSAASAASQRVPARGCEMMDAMAALPADDYDPDDPVEILRILPARFHEQFLTEYDAAVAGARQPEQYRRLHQLLRLWRLGAVGFSDPGYEAKGPTMEEAVPPGRGGARVQADVAGRDERGTAGEGRRAGRWGYVA